MKLYDSIGPNPQFVRIVLAEKGVEIPKERVNVRDGENRQEAYLARNPLGQTPALELDDGAMLTEITAIAEYIDEMHPTPPLVGTTAEERAETRMWMRRIDLNIVEHMLHGFQYGEGLKMFENRIPCVPEASAGLKAVARHWLGWLDGQMAGREYVVGERFTLADILLFCVVSFGSKVGQPLDPALQSLAAWYTRVGERPSAKA